MPLFSIIVPAFNVEKYIRETLTSIQNQIYEDFEVIIAEDCSTDKTLDIINHFVTTDKRFKLIKNNVHSGPGTSRNNALKTAKGDYIACADADDKVDAHFLKLVAESFDKTDATAVWVKSDILWENENKITPMVTFPDLQFLPEGLFTLTPKNISSFPAYSWNKVFRKDTINEDIKWSDGLLFEDVEFYYRFYLQNPNIYVINKSLYLYRRHDKSIMSTSVIDKSYHKNLFTVIENIYRFMKEKNMFDEYKIALLSLLANSIADFENWEGIKDELPYTVLKTLDNINFPNEYYDLETNNLFVSSF